MGNTGGYFYTLWGYLVGYLGGFAPYRVRLWLQIVTDLRNLP